MEGEIPDSTTTVGQGRPIIVCDAGQMLVQHHFNIILSHGSMSAQCQLHGGQTCWTYAGFCMAATVAESRPCVNNCMP